MAKIWLTALAACLITSGCKPAGQDSLVQDIATSSSLKTGMFMPKVPATLSLASGAKYRITSPQALATKLKITLNKGLKYRVTTTADGENILFQEEKGQLPMPVASLSRDGKMFQWSFVLHKTSKGDVLNGGLYIRHDPKIDAVPWVSPNGQETNIYLYRRPYTAEGVLEPLLVSWLNHIVVGDKTTLYRVGNTILDTQKNVPMLEFRSIGNQMWELAGYYKDRDMGPGTVFWSRDLKTFYSVTPKTRTIVKWVRQDNDSMDRAGIVNVPLPKPIAEAVAFRESKGFGGDKTIPINGFRSLNLDPGSIPVYALDAMYQGGKSVAGWGLTGAPAGDDFFYDKAYSELVAVGAASDDAEGFALQSYSGNGPRPGSQASFTNWNNGGKFGNVEVITNEPHQVARGAVSGWWSGKSDYTGYKVIGQIKDRDGAPTGQYIEQIYNKQAGVYEQRMLSQSELSREAQARIQTRADDMRAANAQITEAASLAAESGRRADALEAEAFKRAKELPGSIAVASTSAALGPTTLPTGATPGQQAMAWAGRGAGEELAKQTINNGVGYVTNGAMGSESFDGMAIATAGTGSLLGNSAVDGLADGAFKDGLQGGVTAVSNWGVNTTASQFGTPSTDPTLSAGETAVLGTADFVSDQAWGAVGKPFGPAGSAAAAAGSELTKVANAEVGSLYNSGRQIGHLSDQNQALTTAVQINSGAREANSVMDYIDTQPSYQAEASYTPQNDVYSQPSDSYSTPMLDSAPASDSYGVPGGLVGPPLP